MSDLKKKSFMISSAELDLSGYVDFMVKNNPGILDLGYLMFLSVESGGSEVIKKLYKHNKGSKLVVNKLIPKAISSGNVDVIKFFLDYGFDIKIDNLNGVSEKIIEIVSIYNSKKNIETTLGNLDFNKKKYTKV
jgi:hypothetical protein